MTDQQIKACEMILLAWTNETGTVRNDGLNHLGLSATSSIAGHVIKDGDKVVAKWRPIGNMLVGEWRFIYD